MADPEGSNLNGSSSCLGRFGDWGRYAYRINGYVQHLTSLFEKLKSARNKVLAHNDLEAIMESTALGEFPEGLDDKYFSVLTPRCTMLKSSPTAL